MTEDTREQETRKGPSPAQLALVREVALKVIGSWPGIPEPDLIDQLQDEMDLPAPAALAAIRTLEREGAFESSNEGAGRVYALTGKLATATPRPAAAPNPGSGEVDVREAVLEAVAEEPGISQGELAERIGEQTGVPPSTVVNKIRSLEKKGSLEARRSGRRKAYVLPADLQEGEEEKPAPPSTPTALDTADLEELIAQGDRRAVTAYYDARSAAVFAYCARLCEPDQIADAVEAAFAKCFELARAGDDADQADLDTLLLRATRAEAAERAALAISRDGADEAGAWRPQGRSPSGARPSACELMPKLLAARASGVLSPRDVSAMDRHLSRCAACRALEARFNEAERAFSALREGVAIAEIRGDLVGRFGGRPAARARREARQAPPVVEEREELEEEEEEEEEFEDVPEPTELVTAAKSRGRAIRSPLGFLRRRERPAKPSRRRSTAGERGRWPRILAVAAVVGAAAVGVAYLIAGGSGDEGARSPAAGEAGSAQGTGLAGESGTGGEAGPGAVAVLSGAPITQLAARTADFLRDRGVEVGTVANASRTVEQTIVLSTDDPAARDQALDVAQKLRIDRTGTLDPRTRSEADGATVVVIAGPDLISG